jgi:dCTP deaminase
VRTLAPSKRLQEYSNTCLLLLKALELEGARKAIASINATNAHSDRVDKPKVTKGSKPGRGVASGPSLRQALDKRSPSERLVLCPDFGDDPIESASRDIHLGHWFRVSKRTSLPSVDIAYGADRAKARRLGQSEVFIGPNSQFFLQPGDFALAASLEYVCLPANLMAFVEGKSSLGRAGLLVATATQVAPGFKGCIVLELYNAGTVPIILRPAMRIAQLVLVFTDVPLSVEWRYDGAFQVQIKP